MANQSNSNSNGESLYTIVLIALAGFVGLLLIVQLVRGQPMDGLSMLVIAVCFVAGAITAALLGQRTKG